MKPCTDCGIELDENTEPFPTCDRCAAFEQAQEAKLP